jgi:transcriptional regulator with XRE-family HTH domain
MDTEALGKRLRVYRAAHSISQTAMAQRLGISQSALSLIETNKPVKQLDEAKLAQIYKACGRVSA